MHFNYLIYFFFIILFYCVYYSLFVLIMSAKLNLVITGEYIVFAFLCV